MSKFIKFDFVSYQDSLKFGKNQENRALNVAHLQKIKTQCVNNFDVIPPITINSITNNVIDGQHRLNAFQQLITEKQLPPETKIKVMFVEISKSEEKQAIIDANTNSKNWSLDDYIASYVKAGIASYKDLENWCKDHSLCCNTVKQKDNTEDKVDEEGKRYSYRYAAAILKGKGCSKELKDASFTITEEDKKIGSEVHTEMIEICKLFNLSGNGPWIESLAISWHGIRKQHLFKTWVKEFNSRKPVYLKMPTNTKKDWDNIFAIAHMNIDKRSN